MIVRPFLRASYRKTDNELVNQFIREIRSFASSIGLDKIGIVPADFLQIESERFAEWLSLNYHGEMAWIARDPEKRTDPRILLPGARSVIVAAVNYYTEHEHKGAAERGKISRYAWGDDYHDIVREKLNELLRFIRSKEPEAVGKVCVDTAPMMDKAWAVRSGMGWLGKHSNVITKEFGSWVFFGELILSIDLSLEVPMVDDHCGSCTACLDACPTRAIVQTYVVDSRRCLSYATIEFRGEKLPDEIADKMDGWLYGCDVCQDVCPWNRFEKPTQDMRFEPRGRETSLDLEAVESLSHESYVERFRRSPIKRAKLTGLKRNAAALRGK